MGNSSSTAQPDAGKASSTAQPDAGTTENDTESSESHQGQQATTTTATVATSGEQGSHGKSRKNKFAKTKNQLMTRTNPIKKIRRAVNHSQEMVCYYFVTFCKTRDLKMADCTDFLWLLFSYTDDNASWNVANIQASQRRALLGKILQKNQVCNY